MPIPQVPSAVTGDFNWLGNFYEPLATTITGFSSDGSLEYCGQFEEFEWLGGWISIGFRFPTVRET